MRYYLLSILSFSLGICPFLEGIEDQALQAFDQKIEEISKQLKENWKETTAAEVHGQDDFIADWQEYQSDLNAIKQLNDKRQQLQNELRQVRQARADYLKSKAKAQ